MDQHLAVLSPIWRKICSLEPDTFLSMVRQRGGIVFTCDLNKLKPSLPAFQSIFSAVLARWAIEVWHNSSASASLALEVKRSKRPAIKKKAMSTSIVPTINTVASPFLLKVIFNIVSALRQRSCLVCSGFFLFHSANRWRCRYHYIGKIR